MYIPYVIKAERHSFCYRNQAVMAGWLEVQVLFDCNPVGDSIDSSKTKSALVIGGIFSEEGELGLCFSPRGITCKPSVRGEVERVARGYQSVCGINMCSVIKETHVVNIGLGNDVFALTYTGTPKKNKVKYLMYHNKQVLDAGFAQIDIKRRNNLLKHATELIAKYIAARH